MHVLCFLHFDYSDLVILRKAEVFGTAGLVALAALTLAGTLEAP